VIDPEALAALLCDWCLEPAPGEQVLVASTTLSEPLVRALHNQLLGRGAWPIVRLAFPELARDFYAHARGEQIDAFAPLELTEAESVDASIRIHAPGRIDELAGVAPELVVHAELARQPIQQARLSKRWCATQWPTAALARLAGMQQRSLRGVPEAGAVPRS
jgi:aminopeptidase